MLGHPATHAQAAAERAVLERLGADCNVPLAALAEPAGDHLRLRTCIAHPSGDPILRAEGEADPAEAAGLGRRLAEQLLASGGEDLLASLGQEEA